LVGGRRGGRAPKAAAADGKVRHETIAKLSGLPDSMVDAVEAALKGEVLVPAGEAAVTVARSVPHGHVAARAMPASFTGVTGVKFGGVAGEFSVRSSAEITATLPAGACTGPVTVTGPKGTAASREGFTIRPGIVLSALSGPPGTAVTVAGAGFAAEEAVDIYLGADFSLTDQALASATSGGTFAGVAAQVPASAPNPGTAFFTAVGRRSGLSAQAHFSVRDTVTVISPGNQASVTGAAVRLLISASDTGAGQELSFTADGLPPGLEIGNEFGAAGVIAGVPAEPGTFAVTVTARDTTGASGSAAFSWTIGNLVRVTSPGNQVAAIDSPVSVQIQATDSATGQAFTWTAEGLPPGLSISPVTGVISGAPVLAVPFVHQVTVTARDTTGASGSATFQWQVLG
jgi:hypothetical protein